MTDDRLYQVQAMIDSTGSGKVTAMVVARLDTIWAVVARSDAIWAAVVLLLVGVY